MGLEHCVARRWLLSVCLFGAVGFLLAGVMSSSEAADPWSVQVIGTTGPDDTAIDSMTFEDAQEALETASGRAVRRRSCRSRRPASPGLTTANASLDLDETNHTLTVGGPVTLLGQDADMLVTAVWTDADSDDEPSVTVAFRTGAASLSDFAPALDAVDVGLSKTWTAFRTGQRRQLRDPGRRPAPGRPGLLRRR